MAQAPYSSGDPKHTVLLWWLAPVALFAAMLAVGVITVVSLNGTGGGEPAPAAAAAPHKLAPYWTVKRGDTYSRIASKTGLSIDDLETFNPTVDPTSIEPGQRLKLRLDVPKVRKHLGPKYWTVRAGQSYGSIAAKTKKPIDRLISLNPKLKPTQLKVGDRVRLRR
jgi:LysM repeat protein